MKAVVVYESMYGNTHLVADEIAASLRASMDVRVLPLDLATPDDAGDADLVIVGAPTHVHGMSRPSTRKAAVEAAGKDDSLHLDPDAPGGGIREWLASLPSRSGLAAAFDTRIDAPAALTGRASKGVARQLRKQGFVLLVDPESFLVTKHNTLGDGEAEHARQWAATISAAIRSRRPSTSAARDGST
jgi:hypothetical protein